MRSTPLPSDLGNILGLFDSPLPDLRQSAARYLVDLLTHPDPAVRCGTVLYLTHTPMRAYLNPLLVALQDEGQLEAARACARAMGMPHLGNPPLTWPHIILLYARLHFLLQLTAEFSRPSVLHE